MFTDQEQKRIDEIRKRTSRKPKGLFVLIDLKKLEEIANGKRK